MEHVCRHFRHRRQWGSTPGLVADTSQEVTMTNTTKTKDGADRPVSQRERIDTLLDEALKESFPASDPISIATGVAEVKKDDNASRSGKTESGK
jgi:hypothetical protein